MLLIKTGELKLCIINRICVLINKSFSCKNKSKFIEYGIKTLSTVSGKKYGAYVHHPYSYAFGRSNRQLKYLTIGDLLTERAITDKSRSAIISHHENITKNYEQVNSDVIRLVCGLYTKLGLRRGDVVGIWSCNTYSSVQIQYSCAKLGVILCTINPAYLSKELNYALRKAQIKTLFMPGIGSLQEVVNNFHSVFTEAIKQKHENETDSLAIQHVITLDGQTPDRNDFGVDTYQIETLLLNDDLTDMKSASPDDPAIMMFTSGTTGKPKAALLSHFTLVNNAMLASYRLMSENDVMCVPLPLFHAFAAVLGAITMTAQRVSIGFKYEVKSVLDSIKTNNCTHIIATPTMIIDILNYVEKHDLSIPSLKCTVIGGSSVPIQLTHRISKVIPSVDDVRIGYGATELGPVTTASYRSDSFKLRTETVGSPLDFVELKIVNTKTGELTRIGEQGELLSRSHNVMIGYWRDEQKTKESIDQTNWYKTGDLAVMDEFGYVKIIGRTKDMVIRGGENIYPREIEELLHTHSDIIDAYVIGVPDERMGEELCAWIKLRADSKVTDNDIKQFCRNNISYFKIPRYILFVDEFPLTATGKAKKYRMREKSCKILGLSEN